MEINSKEKFKAWNTFSPPTLHELPSSSGRFKLEMLRLDLLQSWTTGNKYYKLKYVIESALASGVDTLVSKGGMFSNHLAALAETCQTFDLRLVSVIRTHLPDENNPTIAQLRAKGSEIMYLNPREYDAFDKESSDQLFPGAMFIPEGGLSELGIKGSAEITKEVIHHQPTHAVIAGGTMGTACGIISSAPSIVKVIIVPAWKGCTEAYIGEILNRYGIKSVCSWEIWPDYHFGGFGRFDQELVHYMQSFKMETGIPLDPVYTGKMMFAIDHKWKSGYFNHSDHVIAIHTGGLQGLEGFRYRYPQYS